MLCTVVWDRYGDGERHEVLLALRKLLPVESPDWSRKGVYAYWDPASRRLLYVGLASDLTERFAQHNGLVSHGGANKRKEIDEWFANHHSLGFTVVLQSAAVAMMDLIHKISPTLAVPASEIVATAEGQLIELHRMEFGDRPPWNGMGGSKLGARWATPGERSMIRVLAAAEDNLFVARRTLRDLVNDLEAMSYEAAIHSARMQVLIESHDLPGIAEAPDKVEAITRLLMLRSGHLLDDLSQADDRIVSWLPRLSDVETLQEEIRADLRAVDDLAKETALAEDREALAVAGGAISEGAVIDQAQTIRRLLQEGYLTCHAEV